jgi:hypothetical protein
MLRLFWLRNYFITALLENGRDLLGVLLKSDSPCSPEPHHQRLEASMRPISVAPISKIAYRLASGPCERTWWVVRILIVL